MPRFILILFYLYLGVNFLHGQDSIVSVKEKKLHVYPFAFYTKETGAAIGAAGLLYIRPKNQVQSPVSSIQFTSDFTLKGQFNIEFWYQLFLKNNNYRLQGFIDFNRYPYYFYGIGKNSPETEKEHYLSDYARQRVQLLRRVYNKLFLGIKYWNEYYLLKEISEVGELKHHPNMGFISSLGPVFHYDSRDNIFYPKKGLYWETSYQISARQIGSDYRYTNFINDIRFFLSVHKKMVFAFQHYMQSISGNAPFNQLAMLGGHRKLRGYYLGRYRDNNMIVNQAEWRAKIGNRWGAVLFGGIGTIYSDFSHPEFNSIESSIGTGIRYKLSKTEMTNIRLDFALGRTGNKGFYIVIDEAF